MQFFYSTGYAKMHGVNVRLKTIANIDPEKTNDDRKKLRRCFEEPARLLPLLLPVKMLPGPI